MTEKIRLIEKIEPSDGSSVLCTEDGIVLSRSPPGTFVFYHPHSYGIEWIFKTYELTPE